MRTLIIIPARLGSQRLPRKLLLAETGKPLIQHAIDAAKELIDSYDAQFWAAACPESDFREFEEAGISCAITGEHPNGTSRAADALYTISNIEHSLTRQPFDAIVILQADEPEIDPAHIRELVQQFERHQEWDCATLATDDWDITSADCDNPNRVKMRVENGVATNFSRTDLFLDTWPVEDKGAGVHVGVYVYRAAALRRYAAAGPCPREEAESLEQLRALNIGLRMGVVLVDHRGHGIDTREDYDAFVKRWKEKNQVTG